MLFAVLGRMVRAGPAEKVSFGQRSEAGAGARHAALGAVAPVFEEQ